MEHVLDARPNSKSYSHCNQRIVLVWHKSYSNFTSKNELLSFQDTAVVVKKFMARDPENLNFTVVALAQA